MEKINIEQVIRSLTRTGLAATGLGLAALAMTGCSEGQRTPPSSEQVQNEMKYFDLKDVKAANGEPVHCVMYGSQSEGTNVSKSWFGFDCDFQGTAQFPNETQTDTTSTSVKQR